MTSRTLNGINSATILNAALLKQNNLNDINNVPLARTNLGLVGNLSAGNNISLTDYNGTQNRTISAVGTTNATPNTLVAYDHNGNINVNGLSANNIQITNNSPILWLKSTDEGGKDWSIISTGLLNSTPAGNLLIYNQSTSTESVIIDGISNNVTIPGNLIAANISNNVITATTTDGTTFKNYLGETMASIDFEGNMSALIAIGAPAVIATTSVMSPAYKGNIFTGVISFQSMAGTEVANITNAGEIVSNHQVTVNSTNTCALNLNCIGGKNWKVLSTSGGNLQIYNQTNLREAVSIDGGTNTVKIAGALLVDGGISTSSALIPDINFNGRNITNTNNLTRTLWVYSSAISSLSLTNTTIPIASLPIWNVPTTSITNFTCRLTVPFTYMSERTMRFYYQILPNAASTNLQLYCGIFNINGSLVISNTVVTTPSVIYNGTTLITDLFDMNLSLMGLTRFSRYYVAFFDKSTVATTYKLYSSEITLIY